MNHPDSLKRDSVLIHLYAEANLGGGRVAPPPPPPPVPETFGDYMSKFSQFGDYISKFGQIWKTAKSIIQIGKFIYDKIN